MLQIIVPAVEEGWDPVKEEFVYSKEQTLQLEHSLVSISKWESKWNKAFLGKREKTDEEVIDYIRCMTINKGADPNVYSRLTRENYTEIINYIDAPMTATFVPNIGGKKNRDVPTSEIIYYWMVSHNIPVEFEKWHLNRLLTLIQVCNSKNAPEKKMSAREITSRNAAINEKRKAMHGTTG